MRNLQTGKKNLPVFFFFYFFQHIICVKKIRQLGGQNNVKCKKNFKKYK